MDKIFTHHFPSCQKGGISILKLILRESILHFEDISHTSFQPINAGSEEMGSGEKEWVEWEMEGGGQ